MGIAAAQWTRSNGQDAMDKSTGSQGTVENFESGNALAQGAFLYKTPWENGLFLFTFRPSNYRKH